MDLNGHNPIALNKSFDFGGTMLLLDDSVGSPVRRRAIRRKGRGGKGSTLLAKHNCVPKRRSILGDAKRKRKGAGRRSGALPSPHVFENNGGLSGLFGAEIPVMRCGSADSFRRGLD